jgi:CDP-diacylglycerol--serine O-phosphatidyltransferase
MWIDQRYTLLTGNNLNPRAFRLDLENALLIDDPQGELLEPRGAGAGRDFPQHHAYRQLPEPADLPEYPAGGEVSQACEPGAY